MPPCATTVFAAVKDAARRDRDTLSFPPYNRVML